MSKRFFVVEPCLGAILLAVFLGAAGTQSNAQNMCSTGVCVLTWQNDTYRTGNNLNESTITPDSITTDKFGKLCSAQLDGQVYGQPLVVTKVKIGGITHDRVVYVVTENDSAYAIDGTPPTSGPCNVLLGGPVSLLNGNFVGQPAMLPVACVGVEGSGCLAIKPILGVMGTPVINIDTTTNTGTLYIVAEMQSGNSQIAFTYYHFLHALDITTLNEGIGHENFGAPIQICGSGCGKYLSNQFSKEHIQRPGLLFANCGTGLCGNANYVYVAFSMIDGHSAPYPNGFVFGYNATDLKNGTVFQFQTSNGGSDFNSHGGGIWQGAAPAYGTDAGGKNFIYLNTANGTWDGISNWGDSFLKLNPYQLTVDTPAGNYGYFTPVDQFWRNDQTCGYKDQDFGSGAPMLIPDNELANWHQLAVSGDKEGGLWFMDRTDLGGHNTTCDTSQTPCSCTSLTQDNNIQRYWTGTAYGGPAIHTSPAYWEYDTALPGVNYLYVTPQKGTSHAPAPLTRYPLCSSTAATNPIDFVNCTGGPVTAKNSVGDVIDFPWGATPAISANGENASDAIVWAINKPDSNNPEGTTPGALYAIDAVSMAQLYVSNNPCTADAINPATKFSVPTVANGYVYLGTQSDNVNIVGMGTFYIFGPNRNPNC